MDTQVHMYIIEDTQNLYLLEGRWMNDVIITKFFPLLLKMADSFEN